MKIFLDTADLNGITTWATTGIVDGVTTNPTHLAQQGGDIRKLILNICAALPNGDISVEVTETEPHKLYKQARAIAELASNIVVKIPCHPAYLAIIKQLVTEGVRINITLLFSLTQAVAMCKLGVAYISPFVGRLDDIDTDGVQLLQALRCMKDQYDFSTEILAASLRHVRHVHDAIMAGVDVITVPIALLEKMLQHPLTENGMAQFARDWDKLQITQFP